MKDAYEHSFNFPKLLQYETYNLYFLLCKLWKLSLP